MSKTIRSLWCHGVCIAAFGQINAKRPSQHHSDGKVLLMYGHVIKHNCQCLSLANISRSAHSVTFLYTPLILPLMRGKRARTASSSPKYDRVIWTEEKTARGSRIVSRISNSPRTPKVRKRATPHSKKRRLGVSPTLSIGPSAGEGLLDPPLSFKFKPKAGKVCFQCKTPGHTDGYLDLVNK